MLFSGWAAVHRLHWIELHEQPWFPSSLRDEITDALRFGLNLLNVYAPVAPLLQGALHSSGSQSIVDLCSGGGGPWSDLSRKLHGDGQPFHISLTDKYPNVSMSQNFKTACKNHLSAYPNPVDAMHVPRELQGFRTMFTSFHHFSSPEGRAILQDAVEGKQGIGIFEITRRDPSTIALMFLWALLPFIGTPFTRPFRVSRLLWTYVVPVIPLVLLIDGIVSCLRSYRVDELRDMAEHTDASEYQWRIGEHSGGLVRPAITYLIGWPAASVSSARSMRTAHCTSTAMTLGSDIEGPAPT